jgi:hypothetical protein
VKKFAIALALILVGSPSFASEFCDGFEAGYVTGYKQSSGSSFDPFVPFCPFQPFKGFNDPQSDFEHGYIIGYEKGLKEGTDHDTLAFKPVVRRQKYFFGLDAFVRLRQ